jgi:pimeloyl-ACP methyl ester carboxylesterase
MRVDAARRLATAVLMVITAMLAVTASPAGATTFSWIDGYDDPATPDELDKVGVLKDGPPDARKVLILVPGTAGGAGYLHPVAQEIADKAKDWQVWSIERRENLFEDHSYADKLKRGEITPTQFYEYYLGWRQSGSTPRYSFTSLPGGDYARGWGMRVAVGDVRKVVEEARADSRQVVLGGHSLGASITTAYASWDFDGEVGGDDLSGLVAIDGGSGASTLTADQAANQLLILQSTPPWTSIGPIPSPFAGLFNIVGSGLAKTAPHAPSAAQGFFLLPSILKPPVQATNEAQYGYAIDTETSPSFLALTQVHAGRLAAGGTPLGWEGAGEITPIQRVADLFFGTGLEGIDGTAWFHPQRLSIDSGAVNAGIANPAQDVLDVSAIHGADLGHLRLYAFATTLGAQRVLDAATLLAGQSGIRSEDVTLVDGRPGYAHVDPLSAYPQNDFVDTVVPFLKSTKKVLPEQAVANGRR